MNASLLRKLIVEFIGTFFLVYVIGCASLQDHVFLGPLAIGASLMVMIFAGGHISGAHYNPAVTLGVWIRGACTTREAGCYLVAQAIGAIVAALAAGFLLGHGSPAASTATAAQVILAEALGTFALVYTVLNVATAKSGSFCLVPLGGRPKEETLPLGIVRVGQLAMGRGRILLGAEKVF
jgi:aquaporin Z